VTEGLVHVFSLTLLGRHLYWSDWQRKQILRVDKWIGGEVEVVRNLTHLNLGVLAFYNDSCKYVSERRACDPFEVIPEESLCSGRANPCRDVECDYVCEAFNNGEAACKCPDGSSYCNGHYI